MPSRTSTPTPGKLPLPHAILSALCILVPAHAAPQQSAASSPQSQPITLRTDTSLVLVDVVITEKDKPAHHLDPSRFHLFEDGKEQKIASVDEHLPAQTPLPPAPPLPPHVATNLPRYPAGTAINVLLFDGLNTPVPDQQRTRQQMLAYLAKLPAGTPLAIFTLASRLRLVQGFTTEPASLVTALKSPRSLPSQSVVLDADPVSVTGSMADLGAVATAVTTMQQFEADAAAFQTDLRVRITLDAMQQLARYLNGVPGRKNLIWFSGSFPLSLEPDPDSHSFNAMRNYADDLTQTSQLLADARVAVYPIDARGLMTLPGYDVGVHSSNVRRGNTIAQTNQTFTTNMMAEHATMADLANATGGRATVNSGDFQGAVAKAITDGENYYTLAYTPALPPQGKGQADKFHKLKVKVDGAAYQLDYRRGYFEAPHTQAPSSPAASAALMQAAMQRGAPGATQIVFQARILPADDPAVKTDALLGGGPVGRMAKTLSGPVRRYVADYLIPEQSLVYTIDSGGARTAKVELALVAYDSEGKELNYSDSETPLKLTAEQYANRTAPGIPNPSIPVRMILDIPVKPGKRIYLRIGIRDTQANKIGSLEVPILPAPPPASPQ